MSNKESPLAVLRKTAGISQSALGKAIAAKDSPTKNYQPRISAYETGAKRVPLSTAKQLTVILNKALKKLGSKKVAKLEDMIHPDHR